MGGNGASCVILPGLTNHVLTTVDDDSIVLPLQQKRFRGDVVSFFGIMFDHFSFFVDSRDRLHIWGDREGRHARKVTAVIEPGTLRLHGIHLIPPGYSRTVMCRGAIAPAFES